MGTPAMTVRDVASYLNVDEKTVYRLVKRGDLPGFKVAGTWRFKQEDIDAWIEVQKQSGSANATRGSVSLRASSRSRRRIARSIRSSVGRISGLRKW